MNSPPGDWLLHQPRFRIRKSPDQRLFASFPEHIAGYHVFRRLSMPRHPPYTLSSLTTFIDHRHRDADCRFPICEWKPALENSFTGRGETEQTINNGSIRQKGARRHLPDGKTRTLEWGSLLCRGRHREGLLLFRAFDRPAANLF